MEFIQYLSLGSKQFVEITLKLENVFSTHQNQCNLKKLDVVLNIAYVGCSLQKNTHKFPF